MVILHKQLVLLSLLSCLQRDGETVPVAMEVCWSTREPQVWLPLEKVSFSLQVTYTNPSCGSLKQGVARLD